MIILGYAPFGGAYLAGFLNPNIWKRIPQPQQFGVLEIVVDVLRFLLFPANRFAGIDVPIWTVSPLWGLTIASLIALARKVMGKP